MNPLNQATLQVLTGQSLSADQMTQVIEICMSGTAEHADMARLLIALHEKGETAEELVGAARAMRRFMTPIVSHRDRIIDTCGTGGGGSNTFNISTAAAIVAAAAGATVAKHGNRKSTSHSGSADVLQVLGVNLEASVATIERCLDEIGLGFCFAPLLHPSVKHVMAVRRSLKCPTIFNLLGPLCNPARADYQLLGAGRGETSQKLASALAELGCRRALVVHSRDGLGEISHRDITDGIRIEHGNCQATTITPSDYGIQPSDLAAIKVTTPQASAELIRAVLSGQPGPAREIVLLNAAAALEVCEIAPTLADGLTRAATAIDTGHATHVLQQLIQITANG